MGLEIFGDRQIRCDGVINGVQCKASFSRVEINETVESFIESAIKLGWIVNYKPKKCFCSKCSQVRQGEN